MRGTGPERRGQWVPGAAEPMAQHQDSHDGHGERNGMRPHAARAPRNHGAAWRMTEGRRANHADRAFDHAGDPSPHISAPREPTSLETTRLARMASDVGLPDLLARITSDADAVPVRTRIWCAPLMIPIAAVFNLVQAAFSLAPITHGAAEGLGALWMVLLLPLAIATPFVLLLRRSRPEPTFWLCAAIVVVFPFAPMLALMALTAALARRSGSDRTIRLVAGGVAVSLFGQLRDALRQPDASFWHMIFAKSGTGVNGVPAVMASSEIVIVMTATVVALIEVAAAILMGLHIRSRAQLHEADERTRTAQSRADSLQHDLNSQQLADAIAAEAHDTLAHSLSLIALNASALKTEVAKLDDSPQSRAAAGIADDIRRQAAGALDEAHSIIDMLRNPQQAWEQLSAPDDEASLTRESLDALMADARNAGTRLNTWIDVRDLGGLDEAISKVAYRALQEGLTNARRHAPDMPVSLEVRANPRSGVRVHVTNPMPAPDTARTRSEADASVAGHEGAARAGGAGLPGLMARAQSVGGECRYGVDRRHMFHVDVALPWR